MKKSIFVLLLLITLYCFPIFADTPQQNSQYVAGELVSEAETCIVYNTVIGACLVQSIEHGDDKDGSLGNTLGRVNEKINYFKQISDTALSGSGKSIAEQLAERHLFAKQAMKEVGDGRCANIGILINEHVEECEKLFNHLDARLAELKKDNPF